MYHLHLNWENPAVLSIAGNAISDRNGASKVPWEAHSKGQVACRNPGRWEEGGLGNGVPTHCSGLFSQALTCISSKCLPLLLLASTVTKEARSHSKLASPLQGSLSVKRAQPLSPLKQCRMDDQQAERNPDFLICIITTYYSSVFPQLYNGHLFPQRRTG